jgi:predicted PurR-regulated permease PerM
VNLMGVGTLGAMLPSADRRPVPVRTILAAIGLVLATVVTIYALIRLSHIVTLIAIAGFFAVVLSPAVNFLEQKARMRRAVATLVTFVVGIGLFAGMMYAFIRPIVDETQKFVDRFPEYVEKAQRGEGTVGRLVKRYDVEQWVEDNQDRLEQARNDLGKRIPTVLSTVANTTFAVVTILVLAFLMLLQGPQLQASMLNALESPRAPNRRERVRRVAGDCARAVTGYMAGNLLISVIAGAATFAWLLIMGVDFAAVLALWVAFADLIPLVGATLGAIPTIAVAFLHSTLAGVLTIVFFVVYQQFENHVLQVTIMSRTVDLNPLAVLISVLVGVELFGVLGALLAIPVAGVVQVIVRDIYDEHRGVAKEEPTIGTDEVPISEAREPEVV